MSEAPRGELICNVDDIQVKQALRVLIDDYPVVIVRDSEGEIHALGAAAPQGGTPRAAA